MKQTTKVMVHTALTSLMALSTSMMSGCSTHHKTVRCYGVAKDNSNPYLLMSRGACAKVGGDVKPATMKEQRGFKPYPYSTYVKCYGVAAAGKNDCGTKTTACSGTAKKAKAADAWIAFPEALCVKVGGVVVKARKHSYWPLQNYQKHAANDDTFA